MQRRQHRILREMGGFAKQSVQTDRDSGENWMDNQSRKIEMNLAEEAAEYGAA